MADVATTKGKNVKPLLIMAAVVVVAVIAALLIATRKSADGKSRELKANLGLGFGSKSTTAV